MKYFNRKVIAAIVGSLLLLGTQISAYADANHDIEVIFQEDTVFTEYEKDAIIASFVNNGNVSSTYGLSCTLFGHKYQTEYVTVIEHKVRTNDPRCQEYIYETDVCSKCSDVVSTLISSSAISCCD